MEKAPRKRPFIEAKFKAQKLAFAPLTFQAAIAMRDLGILAELDRCKEVGITAAAMVDVLKLTPYAVETLLEVGVSAELVQRNDDKYTLSTVGYFVLHDKMTRIHTDFVNDVCYKGAHALKESFQTSKPAGLKEFGDWPTIYDGLSSLPKGVQKSWFEFDHFYSDYAFDIALKLVFKDGPKHLLDIGGNTGKWVQKCVDHLPANKVSVFDLPGQINMIRENVTDEDKVDRLSLYLGNVLDPMMPLPTGMQAIWMSQFLDCFSKDEIIGILKKAARAADENCAIYILEPLWDLQKFAAASYSLNHISLYFTCMANGNSKMYSFAEFKACIAESGLVLTEVHHDLGPHSYTLLECRIA